MVITKPLYFRQKRFDNSLITDLSNCLLVSQKKSEKLDEVFLTKGVSAS